MSQTRADEREMSEELPPTLELINMDSLISRYCAGKCQTWMDSTKVFYSLIRSCVSAVALLKNDIPLADLEFLRETDRIMPPPRSEFSQSLSELFNKYLRNSLFSDWFRHVFLFVGDPLEVENCKEAYVFELQPNHRDPKKKSGGRVLKIPRNLRNYSFHIESFRSFLTKFITNLEKLGRKKTDLTIIFEYNVKIKTRERNRSMHWIETKSFKSSGMGRKFEPCQGCGPGMTQHLIPVARLNTPHKNLVVSRIINPNLVNTLHEINVSIDTSLSSTDFSTGNVSVAKGNTLIEMLKCHETFPTNF